MKRGDMEGEWHMYMYRTVFTRGRVLRARTTMLEVLGRSASLLVPLLVLSLLLVYVYRRACFWIALRWIPGPPALPFLGNALLLTGSQDGKASFISPLVHLKHLSDSLVQCFHRISDSVLGSSP
jgi:hypothetical protein